MGAGSRQWAVGARGLQWAALRCAATPTATAARCGRRAVTCLRGAPCLNPGAEGWCLLSNWSAACRVVGKSEHWAAV